MSTKIGLVSDTHSTTAPLRDALDIFRRENVDSIICAGDIAGYGDDELEQTVDLLLHNNCISIAGNHDLILEEENNNYNYDQRIVDFFCQLPRKLELVIEGKKVFVIHASPLNAMHGGIKLLDPDANVIAERKIYWEEQLQEFDADVLVVGHTHQVFSEYIGSTLVINPGSSTFNHTCCVLTLPEMHVKIFPLLNKKPIMVWNWSMLYSKK